MKEWFLNPAKFVHEELRVENIDPWQEKVLRDFADPAKQRIAMQACAGPGKSAVLAWCGWHFLALQGETGHHPNGYAMSVTSDNLKDNLWKEMAVWHGRSTWLQHVFEWTKERIFCKNHPETWFLSARAWSKSSDPDTQGRTLSGLHSKYIIYLIDESGDISPAVLRAAEQGLGNCVWGKVLQAGNPTSLNGMLHAAATLQAHLWSIHRVTGDPNDPDRSTRISVEWATEQIKTYGRENPWVMAYILGLFPPASINSLMGPDEVQEAMNRHLKEHQYDFAQKRLGVDVARFGDDRTVLFPRQGMAAFSPVEMRNARGNEVAARIAMAKEKWHHELEFVDDTGGYGGAVIDAMIQSGAAPIAVNFSGKADDPRYLNKRAEMWFRLAEWVKKGGALPADQELLRELTAPTYTFVGGKMAIEPKEKIKERLQSSPDKADALALTFALVEMPGKPLHPGLDKTGKVQWEYDPFESSRL